MNHMDVIGTIYDDCACILCEYDNINPPVNGHDYPCNECVDSIDFYKYFILYEDYLKWLDNGIEI